MSQLPPVLTPPAPWRGLALMGLGVLLLRLAQRPVVQALGTGLILGGALLILLGHLAARDLLRRLADTLPRAIRDESGFREVTRAWDELATARDQAEARAQVEAELRQTLVDHLKVGVILLDHRRRIAVFNAPAKALLGSSSHLEVGATAAEGFREPACLRSLEDAFWGQSQAWQLRRPPKVLQMQAVPCPDPGGLPGVLVTVEDVTRQEALETTRQKFISNASHELKTPVAGIRVAAENLQDGRMVLPEGEPSLASILRAVDRMTLLLQDITELSRIETGALRLEPQAIAVEAMAQDLLRDAEAPAGARNIRLRLDLAPAVADLTVLADPLRLHQLLENILSNAVKFSPAEGEVALRVDAGAGWLTWSVTDRGPGIPPEEHARIFERFYRSPSARAVPGTGLGLAIAKHLAGLMDGEITVDSDVGRGATFTLRLPLAEGKP